MSEKIIEQGKFRIVEINGVFYIEQLVIDTIPLIIKREIWVRLDYDGHPKMPQYSTRMPIRPICPDKKFPTLKKARKYLRKPRIVIKPIYHTP